MHKNLGMLLLLYSHLKKKCQGNAQTPAKTTQHEPRASWFLVHCRNRPAEAQKGPRSVYFCQSKLQACPDTLSSLDS